MEQEADIENAMLERGQLVSEDRYISNFGNRPACQR